MTSSMLVPRYISKSLIQGCLMVGVGKGLTSILRFTVLKLSSDRVSSLAAQAAGGSRGGIRMAGLPSDAGRSMSARL